MTFTKEQAEELFDALQSAAQTLGILQAVDTHEPANAPGVRLYCSIVLGQLVPYAAGSGLNSVSGKLTVTYTIWASAKQRPLDDIDPEVLSVACALMNELAGEFTLGGLVRNVDLFSCSAEPVWIEMEGQQYRAERVTVPIVINDMFTEEA